MKTNYEALKLKLVQESIQRELNKLAADYQRAKAISDNSTDQANNIRTHYIFNGYCAIRNIANAAGVECSPL